MERLTWMLTGLLRTAARLLPPGRREWTEAVRAEVGLVPAGWPRLSWHASSAAHPLVVTDRVRVLVGVAALAGLPWVGRRRGWFGPVGTSITARLVRVAGCAALCGLGTAVVRMDRDIGGGPHGATPFSLPREIAAVVLLGAALATLLVVRTRWPQFDASALWAISGMTGAIVLAVVPVQALAILYAGGILAVTSRRSPVANASLAAGAMTGLAAGLAAALAVYELNTADDRYVDLILLSVFAITFLLGTLAGAVASWLRSGTEDPDALREARIRQGLLSGSMAGAVCGLVLTNFFAVAFFMMVLGPLLGAAGGALGGAVAADHPRKPRPARSWAAGLFVRS